MLHLRLKFVAALFFLLMSLVVLRLGYMQVLQADFYRQEARTRQMRIRSISAPRGAILARDGSVIAEDLPVRNICVVLNDLYSLPKDDFGRWFAVVGSIVGKPPDDVKARIEGVFLDIQDEIDRNTRGILSRAAPGDERAAKKAIVEERAIRRSRYKRPQPIYESVDFRTALRAEVASADLPGIAVTESMQRQYPRGAFAAHAVGYVGRINGDEWDMYRYDYLGDERKRMSPDDVLGRAGVEKQYNFELRGALGSREEVVNAHNQTQKVLSDESPQSGARMILGIDPPLQEAAEKALAKILADEKEPHAGAAVFMDVKTGEILVLASSPSYDPNSVRQDYARLTDPNGLGRLNPFLNRVVDSAYPMGSVFKVIVATAGLESGALTRNTTFTCEGLYHLGSTQFRCHAWDPVNRRSHGPIDLIKAIQVSCNIYFYQAGRKTGGPTLVEWAYGYGLGKPTGVDLSPERKGNVPTPVYPGEVINLSIGQGKLLATPLQVCRMITAVANGGKLLVPRLRREMEPQEPDNVGFSSSTWQTLRQGLYDVVNVRGGTGFGNVRSDMITIAGKSGTAQASSEGDHAWLAGFAPYDDPQIAFAVIIEHGGYGGAVAGPVAKAIAEAYAVEKGMAAEPPKPKEAL